MDDTDPTVTPLQSPGGFCDVSILTLSGMFRLMFLVKRHFVSTASGNTSDAAGETARHQDQSHRKFFVLGWEGKSRSHEERYLGFLSNEFCRLPYALRQERHG